LASNYRVITGEYRRILVILVFWVRYKVYHGNPVLHCVRFLSGVITLPLQNVSASCPPVISLLAATQQAPGHKTQRKPAESIGDNNEAPYFLTKTNKQISNLDNRTAPVVHHHAVHLMQRFEVTNGSHQVTMMAVVVALFNNAIIHISLLPDHVVLLNDIISD